jgi:Xaa-Pro aminopeptidase
MNNFKNNRNKLIEKLEDKSICILYSGALKQMSGDESYPFKVNTNFYYVTGIDQDNVYLVICKNKNVIKESLYIAENDKTLIKWIGASLYPEEAKEISGIEDIHFINEFDDDIKKLIKQKSYKNVYLDLEKIDFDGQVHYGYKLKDLVNGIDFSKNVIDAYSIITRIRGVKEEYEIKEFEKAVDITKHALNKVMEKLPTLNYENEVRGLFEGTIRGLGNCDTSFSTIAASGKNAATLHYSLDNEPLKKDGMILLDLGAEYHKYHADISRTYPCDGKFKGKEKEIYEIVLGCNKYIISCIKPGETLRSLQIKTVEYLANECLKHGLISKKEDISNYYFHGISHHIGLDTHDPFPRGNEALVPGMIISCEPGLYFEELGIGVRIEDDILLTEDGNINLSKDIIKEVDDIEAYMAQFIK